MALTIVCVCISEEPVIGKSETTVTTPPGLSGAPLQLVIVRQTIEAAMSK